jgi:hypothetical protein
MRPKLKLFWVEFVAWNLGFFWRFWLPTPLPPQKFCVHPKKLSLYEECCKLNSIGWRFLHLSPLKQDPYWLQLEHIFTGCLCSHTVSLGQEPASVMSYPSHASQYYISAVRNYIQPLTEFHHTCVVQIERAVILLAKWSPQNQDICEKKIKTFCIQHILYRGYEDPPQSRHHLSLSPIPYRWGSKWGGGI